MQKYSVNQHHISTFLAFVKDGQIAILKMSVDDYDTFEEERRKLMAKKIKESYYNL